MATYPTATVSFSTKVDGVDLVQASHVNVIQNEIVALEDQLRISKLASLAAAPSGNQVLTSVAGSPTWVDKSGFSMSDHNHSGVYPQADGWIPAPGTWTKGTGQTINVPSGAAAIYNVGDKIKLTDGSVKYFYIVAITDTLLTVIGNALAATPTAGTCYYSHQVSPVGFPQWFNAVAPVFDVATYDNGSGGQPTTLDFRFSIAGRTLTAHYKGSGVKAGSTNAISLALGLPLPANYTTYNVMGTGWAPGFIGVYIATGNPYIEFSVTIADNAVIGNLSFFVVYEI